MEVFYQEITGSGDFASPVKLPFTARHVALVHIAGAGIGEISFNQTDTHAKLAPQPRDTATHPVEVDFYDTEGVSIISVKGATATIAVRAWR